MNVDREKRMMEFELKVLGMFMASIENDRYDKFWSMVKSDLNVKWWQWRRDWTLELDNVSEILNEHLKCQKDYFLK